MRRCPFWFLGWLNIGDFAFVPGPRAHGHHWAERCSDFLDMVNCQRCKLGWACRGAIDAVDLGSSIKSVP